MKIGNHANIDRVNEVDFAVLAQDLGMADRALKALADDVVNCVSGALESAIKDLPEEMTSAAERVIERISTGMTERAKALRAFAHV